MRRNPTPHNQFAKKYPFHTCVRYPYPKPTNSLGPPHCLVAVNWTLIGIGPFWKAGYIVTFDKDKFEVFYNGKVILTGLKDPSTDLWTLLIPNGRMWTTPRSVTKMVPNLPRPGPYIGLAPYPTKGTTDIHPGINIMLFTHLVQMQANTVIFAHQSLCNPKISTLL